MKTRLLVLLLAGSLHAAGVAAQEPTVRLRTPWRSEYVEENAAGAPVVALWSFNADGPTVDASGNGHDLVLQAAEIQAEGRFGSALESFPGWPVEDTPHRARAADRDDLSPAGPFTIELWICPKPELNADYPDAFLIDKKYVAQDDYQLILGGPNKAGLRTLRACLGFGGDSSTWHSKAMEFAPDRWVHVAFTYDGSGGGAFFVDGVPAGGQRIEGRKSISSGSHFLSIGDRIGSYYHGFPGLIDQVRISRGVLEFRRARFETVGTRRVFRRMEAGVSRRFAVTNLEREPLAEATVSFSCDAMAPRTVALADLAPGESVEIDYPLDTSLRPDEYTLTARLSAPSTAGEDGPLETSDTFSIRIVPRPTPQRMPVLMWGVYGNVPKEVERLKRIGFTHVLGLGADAARIWEAGRPTEPHSADRVAQAREDLDLALANDLTLVAGLAPAARLRGREELQRVDRQGKPFAREDVCGLTPELETFCYNVGASVAQAYGDHPAFGAALIHTEVRGHARPCFHPHDLEAFKQHAGIDIPPEVSGPRGVDYTKLADFPEDRVIADDHPLYVYYRWYWKQGDGWNGLNTALHQGLKSTGRDDLWTFHDPAVRVASVYGSGGDVDVLSQWTYSYPDPIRIGLATDELLAMAAGGRSGQEVMKMTQVIWYRSQTAPEAKTPDERLSYQARWEIEQPDAPFITIPPMHLREAFWTKIARPIKGIMYHGWQSLVPCEPPGGYRYTHAETQHELARIVREVVEPLGPTLRQVPGVKADVAVLESFASEMFAHRGTYGWNGSWAGDAYHALLYAKLQVDIVFDETIIEQGLDGYRVLVTPDCDVITEAMRQRIVAFQADGGLVIGDERLTPAIRPDIVLPIVERTGRADADKAALQRLAVELRAELDARYSRYVDTSDPEVIPYRRRYRDTDYIFVVNDRREYGAYVGQHGIVMENGLPSDTQVSIARQSGVVYDLVESRQVPLRRENGAMAIDVSLGPCDGRVFMVTSRPIDGVRIEAAESVQRGESLKCAIKVVDADGRSIDAVVPLEITIRDSEGRWAEYSGYYGAADGTVNLSLDIAPNDPPGVWQIEAHELATGRKAVHYVRVEGPAVWPPNEQPQSDIGANAVQPNG